jgi:hypothetical protein
VRAVLRADATVDVPAARLWELLVDWPRQADWIPLTRVRTVAGDGQGVGGRVEAWTGVGRVGFADPMVITAWDPPYRCEVLHLGPVVRGEAGFDVAAIDIGRCRVTWWESVDLPLGSIGRAGWRLTEPLWQAALRRSLGRLRRLAETDVQR